MLPEKKVLMPKDTVVFVQNDIMGKIANWVRTIISIPGIHATFF